MTFKNRFLAVLLTLLTFGMPAVLIADENDGVKTPTEDCATPLFISSVNADKLLEAIFHIEKCVSPNTKLDVYVTGLGGSADDAQAFFDEMRARGLNKRVRFRTFGIIASASNLVWLSADERIVTPGSLFLLHKGKMMLDGEDPELAVTLKNIQVQRSIDSVEMVAGKRAAKLWDDCIHGKEVGTGFDGAEAVRNGWATKIEKYEQ